MLEVTFNNWVSEHSTLKSQGYLRLEYLTATHMQGNEFQIFSRVSNVDLSKSIICKTEIKGQIDTLTNLFSTAKFHEQEIAQMFGVQFSGHENMEKAFNFEFSGFPLRKDFALKARQETPWPGSVELDEKAKRKQSLPPGVFESWVGEKDGA